MVVFFVRSQRFYVFAGLNTPRVEWIDAISINVWVNGGDLSISRIGHRAVAVGTSFVLLGGHTASQVALDLVEIYDTVTQTYRIGPRLINKNFYVSALRARGE